MQIDEQENMLEMERQMMEDPLYFIYNAIDQLTLAQERLWNKGDLTTKDNVDKALLNAKTALKLLES